MFTVDVLTGAGFDVLETASADIGIELLNQNSGIRAVVSDLEMPGRYNGFALAWQARASNPAKPVVVISGCVSPSRDELPPGARFVAKPFDPEQLVRAVEEVLNNADLEKSRRY